MQPHASIASKKPDGAVSILAANIRIDFIAAMPSTAVFAFGVEVGIIEPAAPLDALARFFKRDAHDCTALRRNVKDDPALPSSIVRNQPAISERALLLANLTLRQLFLELTTNFCNLCRV